MFRNACRALAAALFACALAACGESPAPQAAVVLPSPTPVGLQTPSPGSIYLGAYVDPSLGGAPNLERIIGRKLALDAHYYGFASFFPHLAENADVENGRFAVESWDCGDTDANIVAGADDMLITTRALALKEYGHPFFMRYFWDMNLPASTLLPYSNANRLACYDPKTDNSDGTFNAQLYVQAWQHVRNIFTQNGVTNVIWVWSVSAAGVNPSAYYPGSASVDWTGVDAYENQSTNFPSLFAPAYAFVSPLDKPILIGETGTVTSNQPSYIASMPGALQNQFPLVKGLMYFDSAGYTLGGPGTTAFTTLGTNPYMQALGAP